jgi:uncharacterized protein (TIGR03435 family)
LLSKQTQLNSIIQRAFAVFLELVYEVDNGERNMPANQPGCRNRTLTAIGGVGALVVLASMCVMGTPAIRAESQAQNVVSEKIPDYEFDVVSIKPTDPGLMYVGNRIPLGIVYSADGFDAKSMRLWGLIINAYGVQISSVFGAPKWWDTERFNIMAKVDPATADAMQKLLPDQLKLARQRMLQKLLAERFGLTFHHETKELPCYVMTIGKGGSKFQEHSADHTSPNDLQDFEGNRAENRFTIDGDELVGQSVSMTIFTSQLSLFLESPVVDKTGLTGTYDFRFKFFVDYPSMPPAGAGGGGNGQPTMVQIDTKGPIIAAVQKNLGLKLESGKGPVEVIVIDHSDRPSGN